MNHTKNERHSCPGCGSDVLCGGLEFSQVPVVLNYRFASAQDALAVKRGCVLLRQCTNCGLLFNAAFDPEATVYDERYENTQTCSPAFLEHLNAIADQLAARYDLRNNRVIEVGCGKGDFLRLICQKANATGFGYDTSCEQNGWTDDKSVCFHRRYLIAGEITDAAALIICRHVVEHVPDIGQFFALLRTISLEGGNAPIYIETPDWDWIVQQEAHWDIFYEHCNYFSMEALANLAVAAGFEIIRHENVFSGQYQAMEIQPSACSNRRALKPAVTSLENVAHRLKQAKNALVDQIQKSFSQKAWAIWGAGAKGVCLANTLKTCPPRFLIDSNPAKQGGYIAGTNLEILSPHDARLRELDAVLVANPNYLSEIESFAVQNGLSFSLSSL